MEDSSCYSLASSISKSFLLTSNVDSMQEKIKLEQKDVRYFGDNLRLIMKVLQD